METRTLSTLIIKDEDYIFAGNLYISGDLIIENASLIISGDIRFLNYSDPHNIKVSNSNISADVISGNVYINIDVGDIYCHTILSACAINISGGDITTRSLLANDIMSDGDILVKDSSCVYSVSCCNYLVTGLNDSSEITAIEDIYILGCNDSASLTGRDIFLDGENIDLNFGNIVASRALATSFPIQNCNSIAVGL